MKKVFGTWESTTALLGVLFVCAQCGAEVAPHTGYRTNAAGMGKVGFPSIRICPRCNYPTLMLSENEQIPARPMGKKVEHLPDAVERFYEEARVCGSAGAPSAVALLCRTLIMHLAIDKAQVNPGQNFFECVDALDAHGWVPPSSKPWLDAVRQIGNKAAHKIDPVALNEAQSIMHFVEIILRQIYELPGRFAVSSTP